MAFKEYLVSDEAMQQAKALGLAGDPRDRILTMARQAAPFTHATGNRRFEGWWLRLEHGQVVAVGRIGEKSTSTDQRAAQEKQQAKLRVQAAIALHFPRPK